MKKTYVPIDGTISKIDTIEHEGSLWLVPNWLDMPAQGLTMPSRLVRPLWQGFLPYGENYVLSDPIPKELVGTESPKLPVAGYEIRELPELRFPLAGKAH